jgi:hypothetical protein
MARDGAVAAPTPTQDTAQFRIPSHWRAPLWRLTRSGPGLKPGDLTHKALGHTLAPTIPWPSIGLKDDQVRALRRRRVDRGVPVAHDPEPRILARGGRYRRWNYQRRDTSLEEGGPQSACHGVIVRYEVRYPNA